MPFARGVPMLLEKVVNDANHGPRGWDHLQRL